MTRDELGDVRVSDLDVPELVRSRLYRCSWYFVDDFFDRSGDELRAALGQACLLRLHDAFAGLGFHWPASILEGARVPDRPPEGPGGLWPKQRLSWCRAWVYFIRCGAFVKIGVSSEVMVRFHNLKTSNPFRVRMWLAVPCEDIEAAYALEGELHRQFKAVRHRGEWFTIGQEIVADVRRRRRAIRERRERAA